LKTEKKIGVVSTHNLNNIIGLENKWAGKDNRQKRSNKGGQPVKGNSHVKRDNWKMENNVARKQRHNESEYRQQSLVSYGRGGGAEDESLYLAIYKVLHFAWNKLLFTTHCQ
jgi:hypothetical protein